MKWDKRKGGMIPGEAKPLQRTLAEHKERWNNVMLDWEKKEPWKMFFKTTEVANRFNRGALKNGFQRVKLIEGRPTFCINGFSYTISP